MQHLDEGTIHAWLDGALAPDESRRVEEHAAACEACAALVAEARGLIAAASRILIALDDVPASVIPVHAEGEAEVPDELAALRARKAAEGLTQRRPRSRRPWLAAAAIVFVAVGTMTVLRRSTVDLTGKLDEATPVSSAVATPSPTSVAPPPPVSPPAPSEKVLAEEKSAAAKIGKDESVAGQRKEAKQEADVAARSAAPAAPAANAADRERQDQRRNAPRQQQMPQAQQAQVQGGVLADAKPALAKVDAAKESSPDTSVRMKALSQARLDSVAESGNRRTSAIVDLFAGCYQIASPQRPAALPAHIALDSTVAQHRADTVWYRARSLDAPVSPDVEYLWRVTGASSVDVIVKRDMSMLSARVTLPAVANVVATGAADARAARDLPLRAAISDVGLTATRLACPR